MSADALALKTAFELAGRDRSHQQLLTRDRSLSSPSVERGGLAGAGRSHGVRWLRARAVVRRASEERVVTLMVSVAIVDVLSCCDLSSGASVGSGIKYLEALKNRALFDGAASVMQPDAYAARFLSFTQTTVFDCIEV